MIYFNHKTKGFVASKYNNFVVYYKYEKGQGFEEFPPVSHDVRLPLSSANIVKKDFRMVAGDSALREKDDSSVEQWEMSWKVSHAPSQYAKKADPPTISAWVPIPQQITVDFPLLPVLMECGLRLLSLVAVTARPTAQTIEATSNTQSL